VQETGIDQDDAAMENIDIDELSLLHEDNSFELLETEHKGNEKFKNVRSPSMVRKKLCREDHDNNQLTPPSHRSSNSSNYSDVKSAASIDEALQELESKDLKSILKPREKGYSDIYRSHCKESIRNLMMETKKYTNHYHKKLSRSLKKSNSADSTRSRLPTGDMLSAADCVTLKGNMASLAKDTKIGVQNSHKLWKFVQASKRNIEWLVQTHRQMMAPHQERDEMSYEENLTLKTI